MSSSADASRTTLEAALKDVHATLVGLLEAAGEQRAALESRDRERLEAVSARQESLTLRLEHAERVRMACMPAASLEESIALLPAEPGTRIARLTAAIRQSVLDLREQHARNAALLQRSLELTGHTLQFLQRLVLGQPPTYSPSGLAGMSHSLVLDGRA